MDNTQRVLYSSIAMFLWSMAWLLVPVIPSWLFFFNVICFCLLLVIYNKIMMRRDSSAKQTFKR